MQCVRLFQCVIVWCVFLFWVVEVPHEEYPMSLALASSGICPLLSFLWLTPASLPTHWEFPVQAENLSSVLQKPSYSASVSHFSKHPAISDPALSPEVHGPGPLSLSYVKLNDRPVRNKTSLKWKQITSPLLAFPNGIIVGATVAKTTGLFVFFLRVTITDKTGQKQTERVTDLSAFIFLGEMARFMGNPSKGQWCHSSIAPTYAINIYFLTIT